MVYPKQLATFEFQLLCGAVFGLVFPFILPQVLPYARNDSQKSIKSIDEVSPLTSYY